MTKNKIQLLVHSGGAVRVSESYDDILLRFASYNTGGTTGFDVREFLKGLNYGDVIEITFKSHICECCGQRVDD